MCSIFCFKAPEERCVLITVLLNSSRTFDLCNKKDKEKSPGSATVTNRAALPRHQEEEETDKTKQVQIKQTHKKH